MAFGLVAAVCLGGATAASADPRPNILIFITDDQRAEGTITDQVMPRTRDWFLDTGRHFPDAFAVNPLCCPARSTVLSGRYSHRTGVKNNNDILAFDQTLSLQRYLQRAGYRTGITGKFLNEWRTGADSSEVTQKALYWDKSSLLEFGWYYSCREFRYIKRTQPREIGTANEECPITLNEDGQPRGLPNGEYTTHYVRDEALEFLAERESSPAEDDKPWFLYVAPYAPHQTAGGAPPASEPLYANEFFDPPAYFPSRDERAGGPGVLDIADKPPWVQSADSTELTLEDDPVDGHEFGMRLGQLRSLRSVDDLVEAVMARVYGPYDEQNTLAIFLSDQGLLWREHNLIGKGQPYTESAQIPLYMRWPGTVAPGVDDRLVGNIDIAPTVLQAAGATPDVPMDGLSLLGSHPPNRQILTESFSAALPPWASLLKGGTSPVQYTEYYPPNYCALAPGDPGRTPVFREYYDGASDPYQLDNRMAGPSPPNVTQLSRDLALLREGCSPPDSPHGRLVTFEDPASAGFGFDGTDVTAGALDRIAHSGGSFPPGDPGTYAGRAGYTGSGGRVAGTFDIHGMDNGEIIYSGWFKLPSGFYAQQSSDLVLMQWDNDRSYYAPYEDTGGLVLSGSDRKLRLFRQGGCSPSRSYIEGDPENLVQPPENTWFKVWVKQRLNNTVSASPTPTNYLYYQEANSAKWVMFDKRAANNCNRPADRLRVGIADYSGIGAFDLLFDVVTSG